MKWIEHVIMNPLNEEIQTDGRIEPHLFVSGCDSSGFQEEIREKGLLII